MQTSKKLMSRAGIIPRLRLGNKLPRGGVKSTGPHRVRALEDKIIKKLDQSQGKEIEWVRYVVEEGGEKKIYDTKLKNKQGELSYLVQRFAEIKEGEEVILEMKKQGIKNYIEVTPANTSSRVEIDEEDETDPREADDEETNRDEIPF